MRAQPCTPITLRNLRTGPMILASISTRPGPRLLEYQKALSSTLSHTQYHGLLRHRLPSGAWDSHMHVVEPRYPVVPDAAYKPSPHTIADAMSFESTLGINNVVLVQPSIYGVDNSCLLDALRHIGPSRGRGVVVIDPVNTNITTLRTWHTLGVRGTRVNFKSSGKTPTRKELEQTLLEHAKLILPLGWMIQIHASLNTIPLLEDIIPHLGVKVCIDHFGGPDLRKAKCEQQGSFDPYALAGFSSLITLLKAGKTYVKISAPYRLSKDEEYRDLKIIIREFLREAPGRVLYATDWPHTRFSGVDIEPFTILCLHLCGSKSVAEKVFRLNAEELMDGAPAM